MTDRAFAESLSNLSDGERPAYESPLTPILTELRRKHVLAAFATSGPSLNNEDFFDTGETCKCRSNTNHSSGLFGGATSTNSRGLKKGKKSQKLCPSCGLKIAADPLLDQGFSLGRRRRSPSSVLGSTRSISSDDTAPHHAEALLQSTPHLRHLTPASTDMQGAGSMTTSRGLLSFMRPSSAHHPLPSSNPSISASRESSRHASVPLGTSLDYRSCLIRDKANKKAAAALGSFLCLLEHEMPLDDYGTVEKGVLKAIFALVHSTDNAKRIAGVAALDELIDAPSANEEAKFIRFANVLTTGLRTPRNDYEFLAAVSKALGHMATGAANVDSIESEVLRSLEWLRTERSERRLAAALALKEIAINAPAAFYSKTSQPGVGNAGSNTFLAHGGSNEFLDNIFPVLFDEQPIVRACAADALSQCLKIIVERKHISKTGLLCQVFFRMMDGLVQSPANNKRGVSGSAAAHARNNDAALHGSLLAVADMLEYTRDFMLPRFDEVCNAVFNLVDHPKALIRLEVVRLVPRLARRLPRVFGRRYLEEGLTFLIHSASHPPPARVGIDIRPAAFSSIGQLVLAMSDGVDGGVIGGADLPTIRIRRNPDATESAPSHIVEHSDTGIIYDKLNEIFLIGRKGLESSSSASSSRGGRANTRSAALHCCADLVEGLGEMAYPYIDDLLNDMFGSGLSEHLIQCLRAIAGCVPSKQTAIENRLLQEVSLCLAGTPSAEAICDPIAFAKAASISHRTPVESASVEPPQNSNTGATSLPPLPSSPRVVINISERPDVVANLVLCLSTLGSFGDEKGRIRTAGTVIVLLPFVRCVAAQYLSHPSAEVRRAAAGTCCTLLVPHEGQPTVRLSCQPSSMIERPRSEHAVLKHRLGSVSGRVIEEVLRRLLQAAVSDPSPFVRLCVVRSLDTRYDGFLCQAHHLQPLALLLQDEVLAIRAAGLQLLGRLARLNPGPILPIMRRVLVDLIVELQCGGDAGRGREEATRLLIMYLRAEPLQRLVYPHLTSLIDALPLKGVAPRLASVALEALGELAHTARSSLKPWIKELIPVILETLQDQSSASKQRISLRCLGQLAGSTGYIIAPYLDYPQLLSQASDVLPATKRAPWTLRREVIRTLGILGALDPDRYHTVAPKSRKRGAVGGGYFLEQEDSNTVTQADSNGQIDQLAAGKGMGTVALTKKPSGVNAVAIGLAAESASKRGSQGSIKGYLVGNDDDMPAHLYMYDLYAMVAQPDSELPPARRMTPADEAFYPTVAIQALTRIFKDPSLAVHHVVVLQAIMFIFKSLGLRCVPFLGHVVPHMLYTIRTCGPTSLREALLKHVATLSGIVREHLRPYVAAIFDIVEEFWTSRDLATILALVSQIAAGVPNDFRRYVPRLVRRLLASIEDIRVSDWIRNDIPGSAALQVEKLELMLRSVRSLRGVLGDFMHVLVPALVKLAESFISPSSVIPEGGRAAWLKSTLVDVAVLTLQTLSVLLEHDSGSVSIKPTVSTWGAARSAALPACSSLPARVVQPLIRMLSKEANAGRAVGGAVIDTISVCARQLGYERWMPLYDEVARSSILSWQARVGLSAQDPSGTNVNDGQPVGERVGQSTGVPSYDDAVRELEGLALKRVGSAQGISDNAYMSLIQSCRRQNSILRAGVSADGIQSEVRATFTADSPIVTGGFDSSPNPLGGDVQNNPSTNPVLNQTSRHDINQVNLQRAWDVSQRTSREEWEEWMRRLAIQLLREAPSPSLRACASLAHAYQPLARELFSAAFVCCWDELNDHYKANLVECLEKAFFADVSPEILQTLLNLAEFMEHDGVESGLPIDIAILAELALKCRSYAKALHYKEREYSEGGGGSCVEALIGINKRLDLPEAALGVLKANQVHLDGGQSVYTGDTPYAGQTMGMKEHFSSQFLRQGYEMLYGVVSSTDDAAVAATSWAGVDIQESWLAKLGSWSEALTMYEQKLEQNPRDPDAVLGCMRCLDARGEWNKVLKLADTMAPGSLGKEGDGALPHMSSRSHRKVLKFCAQAAWRLGRWDEVEKCAALLVRGKPTHLPSLGNDSAISDGLLPSVDFDGAFFTAICYIHREEWSLAADAIDAARKAMDSRFTALMAESYKRAYPSMVLAQTLAEMEEIIEYKKLEGRVKAGSHRHPANQPDEVDARERLLSVWRTRLSGCRVDAEVHASVLAVRSLVLGPTDEVEATLTLSDLSRQAHRYELAERVLLDPLDQLGSDINGAVFGFDFPFADESAETKGSQSMAIDKLVTGDANSFLPQYGSAHEEYSKRLVLEAGTLERLQIQHRLYFAFVNHLWTMERCEEAMDRITHLSRVVDLVSHCENVKDSSLRVDCWLKLGEWKLEEGNLPGNAIPESLQSEVLTAFKRATAPSRCGYQAWHSWALLNFRIAQQLGGRDEGTAFLGTHDRHSASSRSLRTHIVAAVKGFVNAIGLGTKRSSASVLQDMLNLLTCLFKYGELPDVARSVSDGIGVVSVEAWLGVLPQLLARIHIRSPSVRSVLHPLLTRLGENHPQALMYPLSVLLKSPVKERKVAAESLMTSLKDHSSALVQEALMVSSELIKVAILWLESWLEGLEDASRLCYAELNVNGMLEVLLPLHDSLANAETRQELDFVKAFGKDLDNAFSLIQDYLQLTGMNNSPSKGQASGNQNETPEQSAQATDTLNDAWNIYYQVFRKINKQLPSLTKLEISNCSPALSRARNLELGVPGSYRVDGSYVKIESFNPSVQVITSKQRPRKIRLRGSDGKDYVFLLKGHEDLRQDERVMQLFGLVNALFARDGRTNKHDLNIQRYAICPLSHNCGVVGWVPHCDTLHSLIRDYRQTKKVPLNMENREMLKTAPDYDLLNVMQKVEVFNDALRRTTGNGKDLYEILWLKSSNSEEWLERRTKFTRSLAVMSMVGYILGLGDRHPSNLMLDQLSGRVLHIDFGDCFEVAMKRDKYPEKVPFRLTRMLVKAMEVSGIEGSYRSTCERTMGVLRDSRDSLVAMLEAFVYDPLISWRLVGLSHEEAEEQDIVNESTSENLVQASSDAGDRMDGTTFVGRPRRSLHDSITSIGEVPEEDVEVEGEGPVIAQSFGEAVLVDPRSVARDDAIRASRARSLQIYSDFQTLAAESKTSSRIATITGDGKDGPTEGSLVQSQVERSFRQRDLLSLLEGTDGVAHEEAINEKAVKVIRRVQDKLSGTDFQDIDDTGEALDVADQVQRLIVQATSSENLCQLFIGWCAFW